jgi:hypothetical protein
MDRCLAIILGDSKQPHREGVPEPFKAQVRHIPRPVAAQFTWESSCAGRDSQGYFSTIPTTPSAAPGQILGTQMKVPRRRSPNAGDLT